MVVVSKFFNFPAKCSILFIDHILLVKGKSALLEAIGYALCVPMPKGRYKHVRELISNSSGQFGGYFNKDVMSVQVNLANGVTFKRSYIIAEE